MSEWVNGSLGDVLHEVSERNTNGFVDLVLSVTEGRGIVPQTEVFKKRIATADTTKYKIVESEDIAWNPYLLWTGAVGQWLGSNPGVTSPVYPIFRVRDGQDARFWGLVLESGLLTPYFDSTAIGSIQRRRRTTVPVFKAATVLIPSAAEQRRIVDVMAAVDAQIEALVEETARTWGLLSATRNDLLSSAPRIPLNEVCDIRAGLVDPRLEEYASLLHIGVDSMEKNTGRIIGARSAREDGLISGKYLFEPGDVIYSKIRPALRKVSAPDFRGLCSADAYPLRPKGSLSASLLRESLLFEPVVELVVKMSGRTKMPKVNRKELFSVTVPIPEVETRAKIDSVLLLLRAEAEALEAELAHLRTFRSTLLTSLLNQESEIPGSYDAILEGVS